MAKYIKYLFYAFLALLLASVTIFFVYQNAISKPSGNNNKNVVFSVVSGESVNTIADNLVKAGLIKSSLFFRYYIKSENLAPELKAGDYELSPILSIKEIAQAMVKGETLKKDREIKIIEGWNTDDINKYLKNNEIVKDDRFKELVQAGKKDCLGQELNKDKSSACYWDFLKNIPQGATLEGFLFPDTYRVFNDSSAQDILARMLSNFDKKLTKEIRDEIGRQGKSIYEIVILASIIEKEVTSSKDMAIVSGIFQNRMMNGQALESCATLAYILHENKKQFSVEDTKINSPYNTYQNKGLPPGPICNPGLNAIRAAVYPEKTDYFYFLSRFDNNETVFSKNYNEHLMNKAKYLR